MFLLLACTSSGTPDVSPGRRSTLEWEDVPWLRVDVPAECTTCTLSVEAAVDVVEVLFRQNGLVIGEGFELTRTFTDPGPREVFVEGRDASGMLIAVDVARFEVPGDSHEECAAYDSAEQEWAPVQIAGAGRPGGSASRSWHTPTASTWQVGFSGTPGQACEHEGVDFVHDDASVELVDVLGAADGVVAYVRTGCRASATFSPNASLPECGSGWGNHVVVAHGDGLYTRYAHLDEVWIQTGDRVFGGLTMLGSMGNSGRSNVRHLHFEIGNYEGPVDTCGPAWSLDAVHDPVTVGL